MRALGIPQRPTAVPSCLPESRSVHTHAQLCPSQRSRGCFYRSGAPFCTSPSSLTSCPAHHTCLARPRSWSLFLCPAKVQLSGWQFEKGLQAESQGECRTRLWSFLNLALSVVNQCLKAVASYISSTLIAVCYGRGSPILIFLPQMEAKDRFFLLGELFLPFVVCVGGQGKGCGGRHLHSYLFCDWWRNESRPSFRRLQRINCLDPPCPGSEVNGA